MNNISFQGHSTLVISQKSYNKAEELATRAGRRIISSSKCRLSNGKVFTANPDAGSIAVIVRNANDGFLKNIPVNKEPEGIIGEIANAIDALKAKAKGKLTAWIIGGDNVNGANGDKTIKTLGSIADELCDRPDIDTSILVGSKSGDDKVFLHTFNNELEVGLNKDPKAIKNPHIPNEEKMENYFDIVELNNTDLKID